MWSYSQGPRVAGRTQALARLMVARGAVEALTLQEAVFAVEAGVAELLAAPALVAVRAHAGARDGVAFGPVPALTAVAAVGAPEVTVAAWTEGQGLSSVRAGTAWVTELRRTSSAQRHEESTVHLEQQDMS